MQFSEKRPSCRAGGSSTSRRFVLKIDQKLNPLPDHSKASLLENVLVEVAKVSSGCGGERGRTARTA